MEKYMGVCVNPKCKNTACYNYEGRRAIVCEQHKYDGMIIIKKQKCIHCCRYARFNIPTEKSPIYCIDHKLPDMIDLQHALYDSDNVQEIMDKTNKIIYEFTSPYILVKREEQGYDEEGNKIHKTLIEDLKL